MSLVVIVPSRGRPQSVSEMARAFSETTQDQGTEVWFAIDRDDPDPNSYWREVRATDNPRVALISVTGGCMSAALNEAAMTAANDPGVENIGFMGDDHRPRTPGWDVAYQDTLRALGAGIVYGDDGLQGAALPTQCAMSASIVRALGWMCPPSLHHLWIDNFWLDLGRAAGCIKYLPGIYIEHMHPYVGKGEMDAGYERVNSLEMISHDQTEYERYLVDHMDYDVEKVRALRD